ncbi:MAG: hypothetical protein AB8H86_09770 [Polyangiales bacterium]
MLKSTRLWSLVAALFVVSSATVAAAQEGADDEYQQHLDRGLSEYEAGRYETAAEAFQAAYAIRPEPELQYNAARSFERAVKREEAIAAYELFLELPGTTSDTRTRALHAVASLRAEIEAINAAEQAPDPVTEVDPVVDPPEVAPVQPMPPSSRRGGKTTAGWVLIGTGAVSLITGGIFGGLALASNNEFEDATNRSEQLELADEVNNNALAADVLLGVGLVCAVVGIVLVATDGGDEEDEGSAHLQLSPSASPTGVGLMLSGRL